MALSSAQFLEMACASAFERGMLLIEDETFLPQVRERGLTDEDIARYKGELERTHVIRNHRVIGGLKDFEIKKAGIPAVRQDCDQPGDYETGSGNLQTLAIRSRRSSNVASLSVSTICRKTTCALKWVTSKSTAWANCG